METWYDYQMTGKEEDLCRYLSIRVIEEGSTRIIKYKFISAVGKVYGRLVMDRIGEGTQKLISKLQIVILRLVVEKVMENYGKLSSILALSLTWRKHIIERTGGPCGKFMKSMQLEVNY